MQIVINLPDTNITEDIIRAAKWEDGSLFDMVLRDAMRNATILPKGHGDLIDKRKFRKWIETQDGDKLMTKYYLDALDVQETIVGGSRDGDID